VSDKLLKQIKLERCMLRQLFEDHRPLLNKSELALPDRIECSALAAFLHGFYNGIENIFKRVALELREDMPEGASWHQALLEQMAKPGTRRPVVISPDLLESLKEYLAFRHVFRHAYPFQLTWANMSHLVKNSGDIFARLEKELDTFEHSLTKS
jgi:hypothetical protein